MNITQTFRRKNQYHKPILIFKELYRDYYKQSSPFKYKNPNVNNSSSDCNLKTISYSNGVMSNLPRPMSKLKKTRSAQQFSQYLQKYGNTGSQLNLQTIDELKTIKNTQKLRNKTLFAKSFDKTQFLQYDDSVRTFFKNNYTQSHPFFQKSKNFMKQKKISQKQNQTLPILPEVFKQSNETLKKPSLKRIQMQQLKNRFIDRKEKAVEKFSKIRFNFLVKKNYRQQQEEPKISHKIHQLKSSFQTTKSNIFPQSTL